MTDHEESIGRIRARLDQLQAELRARQDETYALAGGIAELQFLLAQLEEETVEAPPMAN